MFVLNKILEQAIKTPRSLFIMPPRAFLNSFSLMLRSLPTEQSKNALTALLGQQTCKSHNNFLVV